jgi:hypothetical protein
MDISPARHFPKVDSSSIWEKVWLMKCLVGEMSGSSGIFVAVFCMKKEQFKIVYFIMLQPMKSTTLGVFANLSEYVHTSYAH